jgi:mono/diheme cytochrome c family protein
VNKLTIENMNQKVKTIRRILAAATLLVAGVWLTSCEKYTITFPDVDPDEERSFAADIQPIFNGKCVSCHNSSGPDPELTEGKSYDELSRRGFLNQPAEENKLYLKMGSPDHIARSTEVDRQLVFYWVEQGALDN